jgi:serine/threonine protein kinase
VIAHKVSQANILTPANKNLSSQEQPKRPKILSKVRHVSTFSEEFKVGKVLGKGRFGNVCLAVHNQTGSIYAVKQISLEKVTPKLVERLIAEIKIQFYLKHENCLELYKFYK